MPDQLDSPYPIWTEVVSTTVPGATPSGSGGRPRDASLTALSEVLGWRVNKQDPDGIRRALTDAFTLERDEEGKTQITWNQRGLRVQVNKSGVAALTGAQRSLYERAKAIIEQVKVLLAGLQPLGYCDHDDAGAVRALIEPGLDEILEQFGAEGGPVPPRVDHLFELLVGAGRASGQLHMLGSKLGLDESNVNTVEDEMRLTNFQTLTAFVEMLRKMWFAEKRRFDRSGIDAYLGTQAVMIERALNCVAQSLHEVEFALDSVFVNADERATLTVDLDGAKVTFAELFSWIEHVATKDGFDAIRWSGKTGVEHGLAPTLAKLESLVKDAVKHLEDPSLPEAFCTNRVGTAFRELLSHLSNARAQAETIVRSEGYTYTPHYQPTGTAPRLKIRESNRSKRGKTSHKQPPSPTAD